MSRYLRIAAAIVFALLGAAFVAMWVRSYQWEDSLQYVPSGNMVISITSFECAAWFSVFYPIPKWEIRGWSFESTPSESVFVQIPDNDTLGFRFNQTEQTATLTLPHWFLALSSFGLAALLAFKRTWRFSLRRVLVATTILATLLGLAVYLA